MKELFKEIENEYNIWDEYISNFDLSDPNLKYKEEHSIRVAEIMHKLKPNELSLLIGLYHDIGRFSQYDAFKTFKDELSFDHAKAGANLTHTLLKNTELYEDNSKIIDSAIRYHGLYSLPEGLEKYESMYSQLIREADKIDIIQSLLFKELPDIDYNDLNVENIRDTVKDQFFDHKMIDYDLFKEKERTQEEQIVQILAYCYDIDKSKDFILNTLKTYFNPDFDLYINEVVKYLQETKS